MVIVVTTDLNAAPRSEGSKTLQENQRRSLSAQHPVRSAGRNRRNSTENKWRNGDRDHSPPLFPSPFEDALPTLSGRVAPLSTATGSPPPAAPLEGGGGDEAAARPRALRSRWPGCRAADTGTRLKATDCGRQSCAPTWDHPPPGC